MFGNHAMILTSLLAERWYCDNLQLNLFNVHTPGIGHAIDIFLREKQTYVLVLFLNQGQGKI